MSEPKIRWEVWSPEEKPERFGDPDTADLRVEIRTYDDDETDVVVECLCPACFQISEAGVEDSVSDGPMSDGIHYFKFWHETYPAIPGYTATEYDAGLVHSVSKGET